MNKSGWNGGRICRFGVNRETRKDMRERIRRFFIRGGMFFFCLLCCVGCGNEVGNGEENRTVIERTFAITEESSIKEDFEYFGLELKPGYDTLALTKICSMIHDENTFYLYLNMPKDTQEAAYRVERMRMNDIVYTPELVEVDEYYQKYVLYHCEIAPDQKYEITEIEYRNEKDLTDRYMHYQNQICYMSTEENVFRFRMEYQNSIILQGKLFECIYQFNKENGTFRDLWYKVTDNYEKLDEDKRSFFYFAFNCFDKERGVSFTPEDILQVDVEYDELHYAYQGKEKDGIREMEPEVSHREEAITPDEVTVTAKESKRSNGFFYQYQTINRLTEADLEQNVSEEKNAVLQLAASSYDWAILFGRKDGYRYAMNDTWFSHDYEYTGIEEFRTIRVTYTLEGHTYTVNTDSLIGEKIVTLPEIVPENQNTWTNSLKKWLIGIAIVFALIIVWKISRGIAFFTGKGKRGIPFRKEEQTKQKRRKLFFKERREKKGVFGTKENLKFGRKKKMEGEHINFEEKKEEKGSLNFGEKEERSLNFEEKKEEKGNLNFEEKKEEKESLNFEEKKEEERSLNFERVEKEEGELEWKEKEESEKKDSEF